jgi:hypothetical protein
LLDSPSMQQARNGPVNDRTLSFDGERSQALAVGSHARTTSAYSIMVSKIFHGHQVCFGCSVRMCVLMKSLQHTFKMKQALLDA